MKSFQKISITFALAIIVTQASATPINGRVADAATGEAIIGASIIYNNKVKAVTDVEGRFHLDIVSYPSDINVSYIGYESLRVKISERDSVVSIRLHEDSHKLNEVVVVGYGTQKRTQLTGSVATISSEKIDLIPAPTLDAALGGIVTGVDVTQNGQPGAGSTIRIRGGNSVNASNNPLYVIDGFIYQVDASSQKTGIGNLESTLDPLSFINPSDIDRIEVLKDVSATAIYGSRGANGVIIISTKKGNRQETQVRYKATVSFSTPSKKLDLLNATEWARMEKDYFGNRGGYTDEQIAQLGSGTDWQSEVLRTGVSQIHELSISGGNEKTRFLISANYTDQQGIVLNSDFQRYNLRANIDHQLSEKFQVSLSSTVGKTKQHALSTTQPVNYFSSPYSAGITNSLTYALFMPPVVPVYATDGDYNYDNPYENAYFKLNGKSANPVSDLENTTAETLTNYALINASLRYYIAEGLTAKVAVGANQTDITQNYFAPSYTALGLNEGGVGSIGHKQNQVTQGELTLDYERQLGDNHYVSALVGYTIQSTQTNFNLSTTSRYTNEDLGYNNLGDGSHVYTPSSGQTKATLNSLIARVNYTLLDRYNATATFRADRSSRFSKDNRWGYFPSLGLSWNIDREPFFSSITNHPSPITSLKVRASVGSVGNQEIGDYEYAASYTASSYGGQTAYSKSNLGNSNLKWETTVSWNAGLDAGFWNNRLNIVLDYYYKKTSDLLLYLPVNSSTGITSQLMNAGNVVNRGLELSVDATLLQRRDLQWAINGNITFNRNELVKMSSDVKSLYSGELRESILREGEPVGSFYGYEFLGIDEQNGKVLLGEQTILGSHQPDFFYGFSTALKWKRWDASLLFKGSHGAKNVNLLRRSLDTPLGSYNALAYVKDSWTPTNTHTDVPAISGSWATSYLDGRYVEDASYLRLQNVSIGYTLPLHRIAKNIHLSVSAQNLLTITSYKGYDPELETGIDQGAYPKSRTFSVSAEVNF